MQFNRRLIYAVVCYKRSNKGKRKELEKNFQTKSALKRRNAKKKSTPNRTFHRMKVNFIGPFHLSNARPNAGITIST